MKGKKLLSLVTVLALIIGIFSTMPSVSAVSDSPVKLIYVKAERMTGITGYIEVENIAYDKDVTVHYSYNGTDWYDCSAEYYKNTWGNYEDWQFTLPGIAYGTRGTVTVQFAIKYEVNGQTYWDNNNGQCYSISFGYNTINCFFFDVGEIVSSYVEKYADNVRGWLNVKDSKVIENVSVMYTNDNWVTSNEINAEYNYNSETGFVIWSFNIPITNENNFHYKISYTVDGVTYIIYY